MTVGREPPWDRKVLGRFGMGGPQPTQLHDDLRGAEASRAARVRVEKSIVDAGIMNTLRLMFSVPRSKSPELGLRHRWPAINNTFAHFCDPFPFDRLGVVALDGETVEPEGQRGVRLLVEESPFG
jgi:hypothetical protein